MSDEHHTATGGETTMFEGDTPKRGKSRVNKTE